MPNYDPVKYPASFTPKLSQLDWSGDPLAFDDNRSEAASGWPENPLLITCYMGPLTAREFETSPGPMLKAKSHEDGAEAVAAVPPATDAPPPMQSVAAPPGSPPHPSRAAGPAGS